MCCAIPSVLGDPLLHFFANFQYFFVSIFSWFCKLDLFHFHTTPKLWFYHTCFRTLRSAAVWCMRALPALLPPASHTQMSLWTPAVQMLCWAWLHACPYSSHGGNVLHFLALVTQVPGSGPLGILPLVSLLGTVIMKIGPEGKKHMFLSWHGPKCRGSKGEITILLITIKNIQSRATQFHEKLQKMNTSMLVLFYFQKAFSFIVS